VAIKKNLMGKTLKKTKINKDTFSMGGGSLADKVANNSRKITLIKNVISTGKSDLGSKLASIDGRSSSPESDLTEINDTLNDIGNALALDFANRIAIEKGENKRLKTDASKQKNKRAEGRIEKSLKGGLTKTIAPIVKQGQNILGLLGTSVLANTLLGMGGTADGSGVGGDNTDNTDDTGSNKKPGILSKIKKGFSMGGEAIGDIFSKTKKGFSMGGEAIGNIFNQGKKFLTNVSKPVTDAKIETTEKQVDQLKKEGVDEGTAKALVDATKSTEEQIFPLTTNIPGDVGGNAFSGMMFNRMINTPNLNKVDKKNNVTEITLPTEKLDKTNKTQSLPSTETTVVPYVISINESNDHMTKTPEIHGIILD
tara:strand:+ start:4733 stop:5836 length:1104 start_codon:yes stop_codon:yes gene_type:complete